MEERHNMGFTRLDADLNIIQALDDEPNDVGGLSAAELKACFDEAGNCIQTYLNNTLAPELEGQAAAARIGALDSQGAGTTIQGALDLKADASALAASGRLPLGGAAGGVLQKASAADFDVIWSEPLTAASIGAEPANPAIMRTDSSPRMITYLTLSGDPVLDLHAATKQYVDLRQYRPNLLLNGALNIWQDGESTSVSGAYAADLWTATCAGSFSVSRDGAGGMYADNSASSQHLSLQYDDGHTCLELAGKTVTVSLELGTVEGMASAYVYCGETALLGGVAALPGVNHWTLTVPDVPGGSLKVRLLVTAGSTCVLHWVKLEEGAARSILLLRPYYEELMLVNAARAALGRVN